MLYNIVYQQNLFFASYFEVGSFFKLKQDETPNPQQV